MEISPDGGTTWLPATLSGSEWSGGWESPHGQDFASYSLLVRAADRAGNTLTKEQLIAVDNVPPARLEPVNFSDPPGTHYDLPTSLVITWTTPVDGSGIAITVLAVDQVTGTIPSNVVTGNTANEMLTLSGDWYVHIGVKDIAGNQFTLHYGPWYVGTFADASTVCGNRLQTILADGYLDIANREWLDTEMLDDDERPFIANSQAEISRLYASWDGSAFYLGWQGAWWGLDGDLWAYLDTQLGGTTSGLETSAGPVVLPFLADLALHITSRTEGSLLQYSGGQWSVVGGLEFAQGENGDTEARIPWNIDTITSLNLLAFAVSDAIPDVSESQIWSTFPTGNTLSGSPLEFYHWDNLCSVVMVNDSQPRADSVLMTLSSPQPPGTLLGPNAGLTYLIDLANQESRPVNGLQVELQATTGLDYLAVEGATCASCTTPDQWLVDIPPVDAHTNRAITITAVLHSDLASLSYATTSAKLKSNGDVVAQASLSHRVDGDIPEVLITDLAGQMLPVGPVTLHGLASDGVGSGIALVQVSTDGSTWQDATGLQNWSADVSVPSGAPSFTMRARAYDRFGLFAEILAIYAVDANPPSVAASLPQFLTGEVAEIGGTASDGEELVTLVEVQLDGDSSPWLPALVYLPQGGQQSWRYTWQLPSEDGIVHTLRARSYDAVGNLSAPSGWLTTTVDTIAPQVTTNQLVTVAPVSDYLPDGEGGPVLSGTANDGSGFSSFVIHMYDPIGNVYNEPITLDLDTWQFTPSLSQQITGNYTLWVEAADIAGNIRLTGPFHLDLQEQAINGLQLVSSSPTKWGTATVFTATIQTGANVSYAWNFGDGATLTGGAPAVVSHAYTEPGVYTATVTASNLAGNVSDAVAVQVIAADMRLTKQASLETAGVGDTITYNLIMFNAGPFMAHAVVLTDTLPTSVILVTVNPSQGSCARANDHSPVVCQLESLENQASTSVLIEVVIAEQSAAQIVNQAEVIASEPDQLSGNNAASATVNTPTKYKLYLPVISKRS